MIRKTSFLRQNLPLGRDVGGVGANSDDTRSQVSSISMNTAPYRIAGNQFNTNSTASL